MVVLAFLAPGWQRVTNAQVTSGRGQGPSFLIASTGHDAPIIIDASSVPVLRRRISLTLSDASLGDALNILSERAGIHLSYSGAFVPTSQRISLDAKGITVAAALTELLLDAGVDIVLSPGDRLTLVRRTSTTPPPLPGSILGKVIDASNRQPIGGAAVIIDAEPIAGRTRDDGTFRMTEVTPGTHTLRIRMLGYTTQSRRIEVAEGTTAPIIIALERSPYPHDQDVVTGPVAPTELKAIPTALTLITAKDIEQRGITKIDQLFRGDVPGLYALNQGSASALDEVVMFSRGATALSGFSAGTALGTNPIKTYVDGVELADPQYINQIDPATIERIEIIAGPQASTIYGSNALNGVMQIFTKRGISKRPVVNATLTTGLIENNISTSLAPTNTAIARVSSSQRRLSYDIGGSVDHVGAWTPAKRTTRYSGSGGLRVNVGKLWIDASARHGKTENDRRGDIRQVQTSWRELGLIQPNGSAGVSPPATSTLNGQTLGLTLTFSPTTWWIHELVVGEDKTNSELLGTTPGFVTPADSLISYTQFKERRVSERYTTTTRFPFARIAEATLVFGADHWNSRTVNATASSTSPSGPLGSRTVVKDPPGKNTGGFLQAQLALWNQLYLTYGLRAEWNPNYGDEAQPNYAPRYGAAFTREFGPLTTKLRASYGRSTRPPSQRAKVAVAETNPITISLYGNFNSQIESNDLGPETQQGIEAGIELYYRNRASFVVTRYNQTVDDLIYRVFPVDSIRSLAPNPQLADSHDSQNFGFLYITQQINVGSIRNQGWELQGAVYLGPLVTRATYSWTKSRVIGVSPRYRALFATNAFFQVGRPFDYLPEHTWAVTETYAKGPAVVGVTFNGHGQFYKGRDYLAINANTTWRDPYYRLRQNLPSFYRPLGPKHATADINASYRFTSGIEAIAQVKNIADYYQEDIDVAIASIGRQSKVGLRLKF
jgi:outer membrane receptor protein involved in Fe transport